MATPQEEELLMLHLGILDISAMNFVQKYHGDVYM